MSDIPLRDYFAAHADTDGIEFNDVQTAADWMGIASPDQSSTVEMLEFSFKLDAFIRYKKVDAILAERLKGIE